MTASVDLLVCEQSNYKSSEQILMNFSGNVDNWPKTRCLAEVIMHLNYHTKTLHVTVLTVKTTFNLIKALEPRWQSINDSG